MPLSRPNRALFTERWQSGLVPGRVATMPATVKVFTRTVSYVANVPTPTETALYTGVARIQPARMARKNPEIGDTRVDQTTRFQVLLNDTDFKAETMYVRVTACPLNPALVNGAVYSLIETTDSSNPIERTFSAVVDTSGE